MAASHNIPAASTATTRPFHAIMRKPIGLAERTTLAVRIHPNVYLTLLFRQLYLSISPSLDPSFPLPLTVREVALSFFFAKSISINI
jgi:hypothetical protein